MFNLEEQIQAWRQAALVSMRNDPQVVDELENHLREEMEQLVKAGQSPQNAWETALRRFGASALVAAEFQKNSRTRYLPAWVAMIAVAAVCVLVAWFVGARVFRGAVRPLLAVHVFAVTAGYVAVLAIGLLSDWQVLAGALRSREMSHESAFHATARMLAWVATGSTAIAIFLGAWWASDHLGRWWGWDPKEIGGLGVLGWAILSLLAFRDRGAPGDAPLLVGVMGNIVVALSWFGPFLLAPVRSYGLRFHPAWLAGFLLVHVLILGIAFTAPRNRSMRAL